MEPNVCSMSVSTSSALKAGFLSTSLIKELIVLALRECFEANSLKIASLPVIMPAASLSKGGSNPACEISYMISGKISDTMV
jgi:hypothetical protein